MAAPVAWTPRVLSFGFDKLGVVVAALLAVGAVAPFAVFRANRIVAGEAKLFFEALPPLSAALFALVVFAAAIVSLSRTPPRARLATAVAFAIAAAGLIGIAADHLTPPGNRFGRVAPGTGFWVFAFADFDPLRQFRRAFEAQPPGAHPGAGDRRGGLCAGAVVGGLERIVDPQGICDPRRRVLARGGRASHSRGRFARRSGGGGPAARRCDRAQKGIARAGARHAQRDPDGPLDRAVRHPDRAARLDLGPCARRRGARRPRHRRRAGVPGPLSLFAAADDGQYRRRPRPVAARRRRCRQRHGHDRPAAAAFGRTAARAAGYPDRRSHRARTKYRTGDRRRADRRRRFRRLRLRGPRSDCAGPDPARRGADCFSPLPPPSSSTRRSRLGTERGHDRDRRSHQGLRLGGAVDDVSMVVKRAPSP